MHTPDPHRGTAAALARPGRRATALALAAAVSAVGLVVATQSGAGAAVQGSLPADTQFYRDPTSQAVRWVAANPGDSRTQVISKRIASQPQGIWFANYRPDTVTSDVRAVTSAAAQAGQVPVVVAYMIPNRDCGGASAGGAPDLASYDAWVTKFAAGLGSSRAVVVLEPDSIALTTCLSAQQQNDRFASLSRAVGTIHAANPNAKVYLDGGHSTWNSPGEQANRLRSAGVLNSDGFFTNVSNFNTTSSESSFAHNVLSSLGNPGNLHAVIDTSRNGNGPAGSAWCDPSGRKIGNYPSAATGDTAIDAFLWIKPPGEADGCAAAAGTFVPDIAYQLAVNAPDPVVSSPSPSTQPPSSQPPTSQPPTSQPPTSQPPTGNASCSVAYRANSWAGGFTADVTVKNTGSAAISGWTVKWTYPGDQKITSGWNAKVSQSGAVVTATDLGYNGALAAGASTSFGVQATYGSNNTAPTAFTVNGSTCTTA
ncbi:glycoside hydrolase family 6 protein [Streptomyces sp. TLI_171]|uniref:glycoside hydrolase family 6 protein n=1 Tax=Streptomyces sp. TLI_171 TaxID=1938859 RepID=UPI000C17FBCE|nr:glycoside hydrolase family 6 protein [Streptomyces sp. TLI_171]RKE23297.1 endoglucanase [Streptomyces sp. TLI_171]